MMITTNQYDNKCIMIVITLSNDDNEEQVCSNTTQILVIPPVFQNKDIQKKLISLLGSAQILAYSYIRVRNLKV